MSDNLTIYCIIYILTGSLPADAVQLQRGGSVETQSEGAHHPSR